MTVQHHMHDILITYVSCVDTIALLRCRNGRAAAAAYCCHCGPSALCYSSCAPDRTR